MFSAAARLRSCVGRLAAGAVRRQREQPGAAASNFRSGGNILPWWCLGASRNFASKKVRDYCDGLILFIASWSADGAPAGVL